MQVDLPQRPAIAALCSTRAEQAERSLAAVRDQGAAAAGRDLTDLCAVDQTSTGSWQRSCRRRTSRVASTRRRLRRRRSGRSLRSPGSASDPRPRRRAACRNSRPRGARGRGRASIRRGARRHRNRGAKRFLRRDHLRTRSVTALWSRRPRRDAMKRYAARLEAGALEPVELRCAAAQSGASRPTGTREPWPSAPSSAAVEPRRAEQREHLALVADARGRHVERGARSARRCGDRVGVAPGRTTCGRYSSSRCRRRRSRRARPAGVKCGAFATAVVSSLCAASRLPSSDTRCRRGSAARRPPASTAARARLIERGDHVLARELRGDRRARVIRFRGASHPRRRYHARRSADRESAIAPSACSAAAMS